MADRSSALLVAFLLVVGTLPEALAVGGGRQGTRTFSVLSRPIYLKYGEVHNTIQDPIRLPEDLVREFASKPMAIVDYSVDIVDKEGTRVPLYDGYNHHYALGIGGYEALNWYYKKHKNDPYGGYELNATQVPTMRTFMDDMRALSLDVSRRGRRRAANFGGGSGAEERGTSHLLPAPFAHVVDKPEALIPLIHLINTKAPDRRPGDGYSKLLECPCTPQRRFDESTGHIDGKPPVPPFSCNSKFEDEGNPSCSFDAYEGGFRCCEHGVFLLDTSVHDVSKEETTEFFFKFDFEFLELEPETRQVRPPACCDVTSNRTVGGNIEFDVPACSEGVDPEDCVYEMSSSQTIDMMPNYHHKTEHLDVDPREVVELVYAVGHLHVGGLSLDLYDDDSGELLCHSVPKYGATEAAGDEEGYVVGMSSCTFDPPIKMTRDTVVRTVSRYNNTVGHHGVMALWLMQVSDPAPTPSIQAS